MSYDFPYPGCFTFVDVEIPNLNNDCICAISLIVIENHKEVLRHTELIDPKTFFSANNIRIHGIHRKDVIGARTFPVFWQEYGKYFQKPYIIGAHNTMSDISVINKDLVRFGGKLSSDSYIDTMDIMSQFYYKGTQSKGDLKLCNIADRLEIELNHHDPESDVNACFEIVRYMYNNFSMDLQPFIKPIPVLKNKPPRHKAKPSANQTKQYIGYVRRCIARRDPSVCVSKEVAIARGDKAFKELNYEAIILNYQIAIWKKTSSLTVYLRLSDIYANLHLNYESMQVLEQGIRNFKHSSAQQKVLQRVLARRRKEVNRKKKEESKSLTAPNGEEKEVICESNPCSEHPSLS